MGARLVAIVATVLATCALVPARSPADGDPASDILLGTDVFYPFTPPVSAGTERALEAQTAAAREAGFALKIALIASPADLGVIPSLLGKPQAYADFLDREISFQGPQPLLVVMSDGYGVQSVSPAARAAAATLAGAAVATAAGALWNRRRAAPRRPVTRSHPADHERFTTTSRR